MHHPIPHPATPISDDAYVIKAGKKRGNYNCTRCGLPKKGHTCHFPKPSKKLAASATALSIATVNSPSCSAGTTVEETLSPSPISHAPPRPRRALSFDAMYVAESPPPAAVVAAEEVEDVDEEVDDEVSGRLLPERCLWEVLRRLPPLGLLAAAAVCQGWRDTSGKVWKAAEELRVRVPQKGAIGFVGSVLKKCPGLLKLSLIMESDFDAMILACIAFSCPNLQSLEISTSDTSINRVTGNELSRFIADKKCLTNLKMKGCCNLGSIAFSSTSLSTLWLSDLNPLSKMAFHCPGMKEVSLNFSHQENDKTDLTTILDGLGRNCPKLENIHIASAKLSHEAVLALTDSNLRGLRKLSLVLGSDISDASVAAIASSYPKLELLDLSGSSISDSGVGIICNVFPETLSKLLLALCPNITSSGIQFAAAQLPHLELMDCGMTIRDPNSEIPSEENHDSRLQNNPNSKMHQKLIIKHNRLEKLSLWGCSGLDALYLNCPKLSDLNLNSCGNLHPERLMLQCPNLESVDASGCVDVLAQTIQDQIDGNRENVENQFHSRRLPDGSKRVQAPFLLSPQPCADEKSVRSTKRHRTLILTL